jgi:hypothetical protein
MLDDFCQRFRTVNVDGDSSRMGNSSSLTSARLALRLNSLKWPGHGDRHVKSE